MADPILDPAVHVNAHQMQTAQLQRAWALGYIRTIWPTIRPDQALELARWICTGRDTDGAHD